MRNPKTIEEAIEEIVQEFSMFSERDDKYQHLIDQAPMIALISNEFKTEENIVRGCQARVWLHAVKADGVVHFTTDSDASISKGMIAVLLRVLNDRSPEEVLTTPLAFVDRIGLRSMLTMQRSNGLVAMLDQMKRYALAYSSKS